MDKRFDKTNDVHVPSGVSHKNPIAVEISNGRGSVKNLDVRHWYFNDEVDAYCRTRQGVQIKLEETPKLIAAILTAYNQCVPEENALTLS